MGQDLWRPSEDNSKPLDAEVVDIPGFARVWRTGPAPEALLMDVVGDLSYVGYAPIGSATSAAVWRIKRLTEESDGGVQIHWADGNSAYDNVWDNRASLNYL